MVEFVIDSVPARLTGNIYNLDEEEPHIEVDQGPARKLGVGPLLKRICSAHVYPVEADGTIGVEHVACPRRGTCSAMVPKGVLKWHYPRDNFGVMFREG